MFFTALQWTECLSKQGAISGDDRDKLVTELIQNVSRLNQAMDTATAREQANMADLIKANIQLQQKFTKLQETIQRERNESQHQNETIHDQLRIIEHLRQRIDELENDNLQQNQTLADINLRQTEMDSRMNQTFAAYQMILDDTVDKHNHHVTLYKNQSRTLNRSVADLGKQFHYLSLSLLDTEKKCVAINASLTGTYIPTASTNDLSQAMRFGPSLI